MGRIIADALLAATQDAAAGGAELAFMNSGGVRASIAAGDISYRDVLTVHPFGNTVNKATMSGSELATYLGQVATKTVNTGGYAQFGGINMAVDCQAKSVTITSVGGKAFDPAASYSFSIPSFSAAGGDGYPKIDTINAGLVDAGVLKDYIAAKKTIQVADYQPAGEVSYINSTSVEGCK